MDLGGCLRSLGLERYEAAFYEREIWRNDPNLQGDAEPNSVVIATYQHIP
jgi:hypothetical protein